MPSTDTRKPKRLLTVGPLPPPLNGTSISFRIFCDEVARYGDDVALDVIDSAPRELKERPKIVTMANLRKAAKILWQFSRRIGKADVTLIVGSHQFLLSIGSLCFLIAKLARKPCYFRSFGYLDRYYENLSLVPRWVFRHVMLNLDGLFVESRLSQDNLRPRVGEKVRAVPGYRLMPDATSDAPGDRSAPGGDLRLVFLAHVREEKGVFILLEALRTLAETHGRSVHCDIYGPILEGSRERFDLEIESTSNATYGGVLQPTKVVETLAQYDALVFPTFYAGEGHPGVLMEAMMAGIPSITTAHRSIPELVEDGVNGLLIEPGSVAELVEAIRTIDSDRKLLKELARASRRARNNYDAAKVVPHWLKLMQLSVGTGHGH